jgi:putative ABC transport system permease protein
MLALFREISFRHWTRSPLRSLLVVLGIALGVALYIATEAAAASMFVAFGEFVTRVGGRADLSVESTGVGVPNELVGDIADLDGVAHAAANLELMAQAPKLDESILVLGVDLLGDLHFLPFQVEEGEEQVVRDPLAFVNDPTAILLSRKFATRHHLKDGNELTLLTSEGPKAFTVRGILEDTGPAASFGGQVAVMFLDAAQVAFARGTFADRIDVALEPDADPAAVEKEILDLAGDGYRVMTPEGMGAHLRDLIEPFRAALWLSGVLALLVGGFLVYNAVGVAVAQRRREIGLLRAFGVTRGATTRLFAAEAGLLAVPGAAIGLWLGSALTEVATAETIDALRQLYVSVPEIEARLTPELAIEGSVAGIVTAVLAAWWPARRGAAIDPAIVLRGSASVETQEIRHLPLAAAGVVVGGAAWLPQLGASRGASALAITLTVVGAALMTPAIIVGIRRLLVPVAQGLLGLPGRLGLDYVERALGRSTINVLALMLARPRPQHDQRPGADARRRHDRLGRRLARIPGDDDPRLGRPDRHRRSLHHAGLPARRS